MKRSNYVTQFEATNTTAAAIQNPKISDNTAEIMFITGNGEYLSGNLYDTATIKVTMGRFTPTKKFLNEIADTLAADMIDYVKSGGSVRKITAGLVYDDNSKNNEVN